MNICISREFGSGGQEIGRRLADDMGFSFHNREMVEAAAKRSQIDMEHLEKEDERKANPWYHRIWYKSDELNLRGLTANDILFQVESEYILECAEKGNHIFVGRCADYVLGKAGVPHISIFITAPFRYRVMRIMDREHLYEKDAQALVRKTDKVRKAYYNYYTDGGWGKPDNYDLCINSSREGVGKTAAVLRAFLAEREWEGSGLDGRN